jgi:hypothetical protein
MEEPRGTEETKEEIIDPCNMELIANDVDKVSRLLMKKEEEEKLLYFMTQRIGMSRNNPDYDYDEAETLLKKFLTGFCSPLELIKEEEIFDLFLLKFKKIVLKEKIAIQIIEEPESNDISNE